MESEVILTLVNNKPANISSSMLALVKYQPVCFGIYFSNSHLNKSYWFAESLTAFFQESHRTPTQKGLFLIASLTLETGDAGGKIKYFPRPFCRFDEIETG